MIPIDDPILRKLDEDIKRQIREMDRRRRGRLLINRVLAWFGITAPKA